MDKKEGINKDSSTKPDFVKWFSELNKDDVKIAGGKGANLAEIFNLKINVPPGYVVTTEAYEYFINKAGLNEKIKGMLEKVDYEDTTELEKTATTIRALIENATMPRDMENEILESYETLSSEKDYVQDKSANYLLKKKPEPVFVAVRSSATTEDLSTASFAGQQDSYINTKGNDELIKNIKKCFSSLFTARACYYRHKEGFKYEQAQIAAVIQKMIDADKAGVMFSKDPTGRTKNLIIEAVFGLGEGIVSGLITPDTYIISHEPDTDEFKIISKTIGAKKTAITRDASGATKTVKLSEAKSKQQVLKDYEIMSLAETGIKLEKHYNKAQDIEFAIEGTGIYIVQTRAVTTISKDAAITAGRDVQGQVVLTGLAASPGIGVGKVKIVHDLSDLEKINKGDVLVTTMTNPDMVVTMQKCSAIVTDEGGMTAHASIVSREMGIPAVVGTETATTKLKEGEIITVDGSTGKIYKGKVADTSQKVIKPIEFQTKTHMKVIIDLPHFAERAAKTGLKAVGLARLEGTIAESGKHPEYFLKNNKVPEYEEIIYKGIAEIGEYFEEIWVRTSDIRSDEFHDLEGAPKEIEANPMLGMHGIRYSLTHPQILKAELNAMKRVQDEGKTKIGIITPQVISVEEIIQLKKIIEEINFTDAKLGVMIETPAAVQIIDSLCEEKIHFISFGTNDLTQYTLAVDRGNEAVQSLYNDLDISVMRQLAQVIKVCKAKGVETSICGQSGSKKQMVKFLVEQGIDSISVNADVAASIAEYIHELESGQNPPTTTDEKPLTPPIEKTINSPEKNQEEVNPKSVNKEGGIDITHEKSPAEEDTPHIPGAEFLQENISGSDESLDIF